MHGSLRFPAVVDGGARAQRTHPGRGPARAAAARSLAFVLAGVVLAGCTEAPTTPDARFPGPSAAVASQGAVQFHAVDVDGGPVATTFRAFTDFGSGLEECGRLLVGGLFILDCGRLQELTIPDRFCDFNSPYPIPSLEGLDRLCREYYLQDPATHPLGATDFAIVAEPTVLRGEETLRFRRWSVTDTHASCEEGLNDPTCTLRAPDQTFVVTAVYAVAFDFSGFLSPVAGEPDVNVAKAGSAVPVKFSLNGDQGLDILEPGSPSSQEVACATGEAGDLTIEETATAGRSGLQYDAAADVYTYVWKTEKGWKNSCRRLSLALTDGSVHTALFHFAK